jgi:excisionase family DNA binding protein
MLEFITTHEASELSGYNVEYIRQLIRAGTIKAQKRGRDWWVDKDAFTLYLEYTGKSRDKRFGPKK